MKNLVGIVLVVFGFCVGNPVFSKAVDTRGGSDSAGGDNPLPEEGSAWFLEEARTIHYCVEYSADFGVAKEVAISKIKWAFGEWATYIQRKMVYQFSNVEPQMKLTTKSEYHEKCDGKQDLIFYLGVENESVIQAKKKFNNPSGFVHRIKYDIEKGWSQGYVWLAKTESVDPKAEFPKWSYPTVLDGIVLHELGHIYGCDHTSGTIMNAEISADLRLAQLLPTGNPYLKHIDHVRELALCYGCGWVASTVLTDYPELPAKTTFERLTGRAPKGTIGLILIGNDQNGVSQNYQLQLRDELGVENFQLEMMGGGGIYTGDTHSFRVYRWWNNGTGMNVSMALSPHVGFSQLGTVKTRSGETYPILAIRNGFTVNGASSVGTVVGVQYVHNGKLWPLVQSVEVKINSQPK